MECKNMWLIYVEIFIGFHSNVFFQFPYKQRSIKLLVFLIIIVETPHQILYLTFEGLEFIICEIFHDQYAYENIIKLPIIRMIAAKMISIDSKHLIITLKPKI